METEFQFFILPPSTAVTHTRLHIPLLPTAVTPTHLHIPSIQSIPFCSSSLLSAAAAQSSSPIYFLQQLLL